MNLKSITIEVKGTEITLNEEEANGLVKAIQQFFPEKTIYDRYQEIISKSIKEAQEKTKELYPCKIFSEVKDAIKEEKPQINIELTKILAEQKARENERRRRKLESYEDDSWLLKKGNDSLKKSERILDQLETED